MRGRENEAERESERGRGREVQRETERESTAPPENRDRSGAEAHGRRGR